MVRLRLRITPRARQSALEGLHGDALRLRIQAPPVDGKANAAVLEFLAEVLEIPKRDLNLVSGEASRSKTVAIAGLTPDEVCRRLSRH